MSHIVYAFITLTKFTDVNKRLEEGDLELLLICRLQ